MAFTPEAWHRRASGQFSDPDDSGFDRGVSIPGDGGFDRGTPTPVPGGHGQG